MGPSIQILASTLDHLAVLYDQDGIHQNAEPLYERVLAIREKALGLDHPDLLSTLDNYAKMPRGSARDAEANEFEAQATAIRAKHRRA